MLLRWHWRRRDGSAFNVLADALSRQSRLAVPAPAAMTAASWRGLRDASERRRARAAAGKERRESPPERQDADGNDDEDGY